MQRQVQSFNSIISEEEASAASILQDKDKPPGHQGPAENASGEVVVRQGAGFRVIRSSAPGEAAAAAGGGSSGGGSVVEEPLQPVAVLKGNYAGRLQVGATFCCSMHYVLWFSLSTFRSQTMRSSCCDSYRLKWCKDQHVTALSHCEIGAVTVSK